MFDSRIITGGWRVSALGDSIEGVDDSMTSIFESPFNMLSLESAVKLTTLTLLANKGRLARPTFAKKNRFRSQTSRGVFRAEADDFRGA